MFISYGGGGGGGGGGNWALPGYAELTVVLIIVLSELME